MIPFSRPKEQGALLGVTGELLGIAGRILGIAGKRSVELRTSGRLLAGASKSKGLNAVARFAEITPRPESAISADRHRRGKALVSLARHARGIENS
jgi:hypothetical protein